MVKAREGTTWQRKTLLPLQFFEAGGGKATRMAAVPLISLPRAAPGIRTEAILLQSNPTG